VRAIRQVRRLDLQPFFGDYRFFNLFFETFSTRPEKRKSLKFFSFILNGLFLKKNFFKKNKKTC